MDMTSNQPYLVRAVYEWITDNEVTPYILVNTELTDVKVPQQNVKDGQIVLNISPTAVSDLLIDNQGLSFSARFGGIPQQIYVPMPGVMAIYAAENGQGMVFAVEEEPDENQAESKSQSDTTTTAAQSDSEQSSSQKMDTTKSSKEKPFLKVIK